MSNGLNLAVFVEKRLHAGNCSILIGRILLERQRWGDAARALENGLRKGGLEDSGEAHTLLAECYRRMGNLGHFRKLNSA